MHVVAEHVPNKLCIALQMAILDIGKHSSTLWMTRLGIIGAIALFTIVFLKWGPSS